MPVVGVKKAKSDDVAVVKKMRDYSNDQTFKKKTQKATAFLKKYGLPKATSKKKK